MPSLSTTYDCNNVAKNENTYGYFYDEIATSQEEEDQVRKNTSKENGIMSSLCKSTFVALATASVAIILAVGAFNVFENDFENIYDHYDLYYVNIIVIMILQCSFCSLIIFVFFNQISQNRLNIIFYICFFVNIVFNGIILFILSVEYHTNSIDGPIDSIISDLICTSNDNNNNIFITEGCSDYFSLYIMIRYVFYPTISLFICIIINQLIYDPKAKQNHQHLNKSKPGKHNKRKQSRKSDSTELALLDNDSLRPKAASNATTISVHSSDVVSVHNPYLISAQNTMRDSAVTATATGMDTHELNQQRQQEYLKQNYQQSWNPTTMLSVCIVFSIFWIVFITLFYSLTKLSSLFDIFVALIVLCVCFKIVLKRTARCIDIITINCKAVVIAAYNYTNDELRLSYYWGFVCFVSFELLMELLINLMFYIVYYQMVILKLNLNDKNDFDMFFKITAIHLLCEGYQSIIRFSKVYFHYSQILLDCLAAINLDNVFVRFCRETSDYHEWKIRHSLDVGMRVFSLFMAMTMVVIAQYTMGNYENQPDLDWTAMALSGIIDLSYFIFISIANYCAFGFAMWKPVLTLYKAEWKIFATMMGITSLALSVLYQTM